jgi:hypothetical protein
MRPFADVLKMRAQRAKEAAEAKAMAQTAALVQGAKVMSETNVGGGKNALEQMSGAVTA